MIGQKLKLLSWKYLHLRKHHWFLSLCEIVLPILIVGLFCYYGIVAYEPTEKEAYVRKYIPLTDIRSFNGLTFNISYTPENNITKKIMQPVINTILETRGSWMSFDSLEISFLDTFVDDKIPDNLIYKLHRFGFPNTNSLFDDRMRSTGSSEYMYRGFILLQLLIDSTFIKLKTNVSIDDELKKTYIQEFPNPSYKYDANHEMRDYIFKALIVVLVSASLIQGFPLISAIISEKETGIKELMKLVGLEEWLVWTSWFLNSLLFNIGIYTIVTILLIYDFHGPNSAVIRCVDPSLLWCLIILYFISHLTFSFTICSIFHRTTYAGFVFFMIVLCTSSIAATSTVNNWLLVSTLFPPGALTIGIIRMTKFEEFDLPMHWSSLFSSENNSPEFSLGFIFCMLIFDFLLYSFLAYYISAVNPGPFGTRKSPFFIFQKLISLCYSPSNNIKDFEDMSDSKYIEKPGANMEVCIKIQNLSKRFGEEYAVKGLNLEIYKNEITALLGHNGAGKTTTIAMLTGLTKPNSGSIIYNGHLDVLKNMDQFRNSLGVCSQEDRFFPYLSVMNHLLFFGMLKGASKSDANTEAQSYIDMMELRGKENNLVTEISGGMKRKLCLSIAFMGKAKILILDEPTSGLDVQSRRKLWDLMLNLRGSRTIILTTHHMEEADALGDRIAIMHHGNIECHGTSLFLKKVYGAGYQMAIVKTDNDVNQKNLTNYVLKAIPGAELELQTPNEAIYRLPITQTSHFPAMLEKLEAEKNELGIKSIGISCTTMEDVFLKVGSSLINKYHDKIDKKEEICRSTINHEENRFSLALVFQQLRGLFWKKLLYSSRNIGNLIFRVIIPTLCSLFLLWASSSVNIGGNQLELSLSTYPGSYFMLQSRNETEIENIFVQLVRSHGNEIMYTSSNNIVDGLLEYSQRDLLSYWKDVILAGEFNKTSNLLMYSATASHSLPIAINTFTNTLLRKENSSAKYSITTINHPKIRSSWKSEIKIFTVIVWWIILTFFTIDLCDFFNISIRSERVEGFKHLQLMSKVTPCIYWVSHLLFDYILFLVIIVSRIVIYKLFDKFNVIDFNYHTAVIFLAFIVFIPAGLLFTYTVSFLSKSKESSYILTSIFNIIGTILVIVFYIWQLQKEIKTSTMFYSIKYFILLTPPLNFSLMFIKIIDIRYKSISSLDLSLQKKDVGIETEILFLIFDIFFYSLLITLIEFGVIKILLNNISNALFPSNGVINHDEVDRNVQIELKKVDEYSDDSLKLTEAGTTLLVKHVKKQFIKLVKPFTAIHDVTFRVKMSQCFGLLGVNGAGKSTTFKILAGEMLPTSGDASIFGTKLSNNKNNYLAKTGYCAQTNCFIGELTGREMLILIATLRGVRPSHVLKTLVDKWISILGLEIYQNRQCGTYSGGNKRKLCTGLSLIGDPNVVFLDEPTTGVDPASRRKLYDVIGQSKSTGQSVVLTSHSMDECELLCDNLTIMVKGEMKCLGTPQALKQQYAQGFSVHIKVQESAASDEALLLVKNSLCDLFGQQFCIMKDEHKGLLEYHITDTRIPWSEAFQKMEKIKFSHDIVEDYIVTDTSLEQVFLSFAKM